jgi:hypothetical protein
MRYVHHSMRVAILVAGILAGCGTPESKLGNEGTPEVQDPCSLRIDFLGFDEEGPVIALTFRNNTVEPVLLYSLFEAPPLSKRDGPPDSTLEVLYYSQHGKELKPTQVPREYYALYEPPAVPRAGLVTLQPEAVFQSSVILSDEFGYDASWSLPMELEVRFSSDAAAWLRAAGEESQDSDLMACSSAHSQLLRIDSTGAGRTRTLRIIRELQRLRRRPFHIAVKIGPGGMVESCEVEDSAELSKARICTSLQAWNFAADQWGQTREFTYSSRPAWYGPL